MLKILKCKRDVRHTGEKRLILVELESKYDNILKIMQIFFKAKRFSFVMALNVACSKSANMKRFYLDLQGSCTCIKYLYRFA